MRGEGVLPWSVSCACSHTHTCHHPQGKRSISGCVLGFRTQRNDGNVCVCVCVCVCMCVYWVWFFTDSASQ